MRTGKKKKKKKPKKEVKRRNTTTGRGKKIVNGVISVSIADSLQTADIVYFDSQLAKACLRTT